jgi:hypothetical protein
MEGYHKGTWVLIDCADLIVHVFDDETRRFYTLNAWAPGCTCGGAWGGVGHVPVFCLRGVACRREIAGADCPARIPGQDIGP